MIETQISFNKSSHSWSSKRDKNHIDDPLKITFLRKTHFSLLFRASRKILCDSPNLVEFAHISLLGYSFQKGSGSLLNRVSFLKS